MKQPGLGKKITELRKEKGLTQEELVEKCNISVRTIQRIEAGEVIPRSYTVKTILSALDYNLEKMQEEFSDNDQALDLPSNAFRNIMIAFYTGIVYFIIGFIEFYVDFDAEFGSTLEIADEFYVALKAVCLVTTLGFYYGFVVSGTIFHNYLLKASSGLIMVIFSVSYIYDIYCWYYPSSTEEYFALIFSIVIGCAFVLNGIGILRLKKYFGTNLSAITASLLIATGITLITVLLFIIGLFLLIPVTILQLILLYRMKEYLKNI